MHLTVVEPQLSFIRPLLGRGSDVLLSANETFSLDDPWFNVALVVAPEQQVLVAFEHLARVHTCLMRPVKVSDLEFNFVPGAFRCEYLKNDSYIEWLLNFRFVCTLKIKILYLYYCT